MCCMFVGLIILMSMMMDIWWLKASIACFFRCDEIGKMTSGPFYSFFPPSTLLLLTWYVRHTGHLVVYWTKCRGHLRWGIRCPVHTLETIAGFAITQEVRSTHRNAVDTSVMMEIV